MFQNNNYYLFEAIKQIFKDKTNSFPKQNYPDDIPIDKPIITPQQGHLTVVTGFISVKKENFKKHRYNYQDKALPTLSLNNDMVIFVSEDFYDFVKSIRDKINYKTKIEILKTEDLYQYENLSQMTENCKKNIEPYHNPLYIMAVNSRYKYVKLAIKKNYFNSDYYAWIDFAASHIVDIPLNFTVKYTNPDQVRVAWIGRYKNNKFVFNHKCMGGGIFAAHKNTMLKYIDLHDQYFTHLMDMGYSINDDKLLYLIFRDHPELFDYYFSGYKYLIIKL